MDIIQYFALNQTSGSRAASRTMFAAAKSSDKEMLVLDGGSHQVLTDPGWERPLEATVKWIRQRLAANFM